MDKNGSEKTVECNALLKQALETLLFEESGENEIDMVLQVMSKVTFKAGEYAIVQGDNGDKFYVVEHGSLDFVVNERVVGKVQAGGHFGELALIYDAPRAASVRSTTESILWTLGRDDFRTIQAQTSSDSLVRRAKWLQQVPILGSLSARQLSLLAAALESTVFSDKESIIVQGDVGDAFYIVEEGCVTCKLTSHGEDENDKVMLNEGDYFGEMALMNDQPRNASILAHGAVKCLKLGRREFDSMLGPLAAILEDNNTRRVLQLLPKFKDSDERALYDVVHSFATVTFESDEEIFKYGTNDTGLYIIQSGSVTLSRPGESPHVLQVGDYFGSESLEDKPASSDATSIDTVRCLRLTIQALTDGPIIKTGICHDVTGTSVQKNELSKLDFKDLVHIGVLGEGSFGKVAMVQAFAEEVEYVLALKSMSKAHIIECHQEKHVMREKEILQSLPPHPFISRLYATHQNQNYLYMLLGKVTIIKF